MNGYDPKGCITRNHFYGYRPSRNPQMPPPLHVMGMCDEANWYPLARPMPTAYQPGPRLVGGSGGMPCLGVDPTDPTTWAGRGYRQSAGMIGWLNGQNDWRGNPEQLNPLGMGG